MKLLLHGIFYPSHIKDLGAVFSDYLPGKKFLDLGSGDGRVVNFALEFTNNPKGIEINEGLYNNSTLKDLITFGNMFSIDFSQEEILYYYIKGSNHELELIQKLNEEFKGILIINYKSMKEKQVNTFASFLKAKLVKTYSYVKVYKF